MAILQRFRSGDRDQATDASRLAAVRAAMTAALADARREYDGLRRRAEEAGADAAFLVDGDAEGEGQIGRAETTMRQAETRLLALDKQIAGLEAMMRQVEELDGWR